MNTRRLAKHVSGSIAVLIAAGALTGASYASEGYTGASIATGTRSVTAAAPASVLTRTEPHGVPHVHVYSVTAGDTLSGISGKEYGAADCWPGIYRANEGSIRNPDIIYPGQHFSVPGSCDRAIPASYTPYVPPAAASQAVNQEGTEGAGTGTQVSRYGHVHRDHSPKPVTVSGTYYDPSESVLSESQVEDLWVSAGGPRWAAYQSYQVATCESTDNRWAYNPSGATGLWQILGQVTDFGVSLYDARANALNAVAKFEASGDTWGQWVCQP